MTKKTTVAIEVTNLYKSYKDQKVLRGISFSVQKGTVLALLGPNGAGKTTTVKILSTLLRADKGTASINGFDVARNDAEARANIGLTGQYAAVDEYLTGRENLFMIGRLYRMPVEQASKRTAELLKQFDLVEAADRPVRTYSGGMRRRIDLAMSLIASPPVIFLDEPTTGLDPPSRLTMWEMVKKLVDEGTTVLLTTQYMDEADHLANEIVVIDNGSVIAKGTPDQLKRKIGSDRLEFSFTDKKHLEKALNTLSSKKPLTDNERNVLSVATKDGVKDLKDMLTTLEKARVPVASVELRRPTLDDVFLSLTGHKTAIEESEGTK